MHRALLALLAALLASGPLRAEGEKIDCDNAMSTYEMNECAGRDFAAADEKLNATYKKALAAIPDMAVDDPKFDAKSWEEALRVSQRAWVTFRDAECEGHVPMFWTGGTGTTVAVTGCKTELTKSRTKSLKESYEHE